MKTSELEIELKAIDPRLSIKPNLNRPGLANVLLDGVDVIPCPDGDVREEPDPAYGYEFPNGMFGRHKSRREILDRVKDTLKLVETPEGKEDFFSKDE